MGMFIAPNQTGIMNSLPASQRGAGAGMAGTFNSSAQVLSIGIFFTLMILGLAATLPSRALPRPHSPGREPGGGDAGLAPAPGRQPLRRLPGLQPDADSARPCRAVPAAAPRRRHYLTSRQYFPHLIAPAFSKGLTEAFSFAAAVCLLGAVASLLRGGKYHHEDEAGRPALRRRHGCRPRRRWPRPSRCWWTDMTVLDATQ